MKNYILLFALIFFVSFFLIPKIRNISLRFNFIDKPEDRSSHKINTPSLGGISFYITYILTLFILQFINQNEVSITLLASISVLFFTGFLDDIINISAKLKFFGQLLGVATLMVHPDFRILSMHGFFGVYEVPLIISVFCSMFFLIGLINAFNLLDGIDGLTAITGIIVSSFYGFMFFKLDATFYFYLCITTIASLLAFLRFNFSSSKKIFMGDTGSLIIGLVLGLLTLKLMSFGGFTAIGLNFQAKQLPLLIIAILFVPILDIFRVVFIRFFKRVSIFQPDRNHLHHIIIDYGLSHRRASFFIGFVNFTIAFFMFFITTNFQIFESYIFLISLFIFAFILLFLMNKNKSALKLKLKIKNSMFKMFF